MLPLIARAIAAAGRVPGARAAATATVRAAGATRRFLFGRNVVTPKGKLKRERGAIEAIGNRVWQLDQLESYADRYLPQGRNAVRVKIVGQPQANLNNLYQFAVAAAFGALPAFRSVSACSFMAAIDHREKIVEVTITVGMSGKMSALFAGEMRSMIVRAVSSTIYASGTWPGFLYGSWTGTAPAIFGANQVVVTDTPSSNPQLPFSNGTRGYLSTIAAPAPIKPTVCSSTPAPKNQPQIGGSIGSDGNITGSPGGSALTPAQLQLLQQLFGL